MVWYILTGLIVLAGCWGFVIYVPRSKYPPRKWTEFAFYSSFLFYLLCRAYWRYRTRPRLWVSLVVVLVVHVSIYIPVLAHTEAMPAILYVLIMPVEAVLIFVLFKVVFDWLPDPKRMD